MCMGFCVLCACVLPEEAGTVLGPLELQMVVSLWVAGP